MKASLATSFALAVLLGMSATYLALQVSSMTNGKSDRLDGPATQTAFLPERFGVPVAPQQQ